MEIKVGKWEAEVPQLEAASPAHLAGEMLWEESTPCGDPVSVGHSDLSHL